MPDSQYRARPAEQGDHTPRRPRSEDMQIAFDENTARTNGQNAEDDWVEAGWEGPAKPGVWSDWVSRKVDKGDKWYVSPFNLQTRRLIRRWDPIHGPRDLNEIPSNFAPGVIPVLGQILVRSISKGITRSAVLSKDAVHIKSSFSFDIGKSLPPKTCNIELTVRLGVRLQKRLDGDNSFDSIQTRLPPTILRE